MHATCMEVLRPVKQLWEDWGKMVCFTGIKWQKADFCKRERAKGWPVSACMGPLLLLCS